MNEHSTAYTDLPQESNKILSTASSASDCLLRPPGLERQKQWTWPQLISPYRPRWTLPGEFQLAMVVGSAMAA